MSDLSDIEDPGTRRLVAQALEQGHGRYVTDPETLARVSALITGRTDRSTENE